MAKEKPTQRELELLVDRLMHALETNPDARQMLDDLVLESQTNQDPTGEGYECLQNIRDDLKHIEW